MNTKYVCTEFVIANFGWHPMTAHLAVGFDSSSDRANYLVLENVTFRPVTCQLGHPQLLASVTTDKCVKWSWKCNFFCLQIQRILSWCSAKLITKSDQIMKVLCEDTLKDKIKLSRWQWLLVDCSGSVLRWPWTRWTFYPYLRSPSRTSSQGCIISFSKQSGLYLKKD